MSALQLFLQAGIILGSASDSSGQVSGQKSFQLIPVSAGAKYLFRHAEALRPYAGLGIGLGIVTSLLRPSDSGKVGLDFQGLVGLAYFPWSRFGFNLEASFNLADLGAAGSNLYLGFNTNFGLIVLF